MDRKFILSCESTVDMPYSYIHGRGIPVLFYSYQVDGVAYPDDMQRSEDSLNKFYGFLADGKLPTTSQLNEYSYESYFDGLLQQGDVLHIALGSGMTQSVRNAELAAEALREKYPERRITVIDSLCSSSGYGLLVDYAADLRDAGLSPEETAEWVKAHRKKVHHQFFSTEIEYYRRSGRMSGPTAMLATVLNICPIMRLDDGGHIIAYDKVRGHHAAIRKTADIMAEHADGGTLYDGKCCICHSNCPDMAEKLRAELENRFPNLAGKICIFDIGAIIASHCGPGTVAVFFLGDERAHA